MNATDSPIHYVQDDNAQAPPVVLINSLGTELGSWVDVVASLKHDFRLIRYDKKGHGKSAYAADANEAYSIMQHAQDLRELLSELKIERPLVCGVSIGGLIAVQLGQLMPLGAVVAGCCSRRMASPQIWEDRIAAVRAGGLASITDASMQRWFTSGFAQSSSEKVAYMRTKLLAMDPAGYIASCYALRDADISAAAASLDVPAICIGASDDQVASPTKVRKLAAAISNAEFIEVSDCGHLAHVEQHEKVAQIIRNAAARMQQG